MEIVFVQPPAVAESQQQIRMNEANDLVSSRAAEDFLVACVMHDKAQLRKDKRQERGITEFCPRIVKCCDQREGAYEQNKIEKHLSAVIRRLLRQ